ALIAQTETLLELDALAGDGQSQLRHLRDRASEDADDQHKTLDPAALRTQTEASSGRIRDELTAARKKVMDAADLSKCQDGNADTIRRQRWLRSAAIPFAKAWWERQAKQTRTGLALAAIFAIAGTLSLCASLSRPGQVDAAKVTGSAALAQEVSAPDAGKIWA